MKQSLMPQAGVMGELGPEGVWVGDGNDSLHPSVFGVVSSAPLDAVMNQPHYGPTSFISHRGLVYSGTPGRRKGVPTLAVPAPGPYEGMDYSSEWTTEARNIGYVQNFDLFHIPSPSGVRDGGRGVSTRGANRSKTRFEGYAQDNPPIPAAPPLWDRVTQWPKALAQFLNFQGGVES